MRAKLQEIQEELRRRRHQAVPLQGEWLRSVVSGYFNYHAVPTNGRALAVFHYHIRRLWLRTLQRRSERGRLDMAEDREARCRMAPQTQNPSSLATRTLRRQTPKVGAVCGKAACTSCRVVAG